jgi:hypothetical protein
MVGWGGGRGAGSEGKSGCCGGSVAFRLLSLSAAGSQCDPTCPNQD